ncbi:putative G3BP-like protein [Olea europaea var. sylvestris]|nr:putative G3BP-like protein [Olea europaea var. sylvestris]
MEIKSIDAQESLEGGVIVVVTGLIEKDNLRKNFSQTFFLAEQEKGYYVLNDICKFLEVCESISNIAIHDDDGNNQVAPFTNDPGESVHAVGEPVSNVKEDAPKISYASMVAKEGHVTASVSPNDDQPSAGSPAPKSSTSFADNASKIRSHRSVASNTSSHPNNIAPKISILRNDSPNISTYTESRSIYIGGLPYSITKSEVLNIIKQFGQVRRSSDSIQIRKHKDGFCCGFVEFESSESARLAIEARYVTFGEKEAYIAYKRSSYPGRNSLENFPGKDGFQKRNFRGSENGDKGQFTAPRHSRRADHLSNKERVHWQRKAA